MNFVRNKTRLKGDIYSVMRSLMMLEKISKWSNVTPTSIEKVSNQRVDWTVAIEGEDLLNCQFHVMRCASKTEFCTEVHMVASVSDQTSERIDDFSKALLETLRTHYNKTWVIGDNELNASIFLESF